MLLLLRWWWAGKPWTRACANNWRVLTTARAPTTLALLLHHRHRVRMLAAHDLRDAIGEVDLDMHAHDLLAGLCEEGAFLFLEKATRRPGTHLVKCFGRRGREHGHQVMSGGWCGVLARWEAVGCLGEVDIWGV
jgi:hypothetical protein